MDRRHEIEQLTRTFLSAMSLSVQADVTEEADCVRVDLTGQDSYLLIERKGSVLEALQLLMTKVAEAQFGLDKRLVVDCQSFRRSREDEIVDLARRAAEKARTSRQPVELAPMNSYERRLVHLALKDEAGITSESVGDGFIKKIVITPA